MTNRREVLAALLSIACSANFARAQGPVRKVLLLNRTPELGRALITGLREHGWEEGRNLAFEEIRDNPENPRVEIERAIQRKPDVLVLAAGIRIAEAIKLTRTIPIVGIDLESDPVASGFVKSLARPGGNLTGVWVDLPELAGKLLQYLRELLPGIAAVGVLWDDRIGQPQFNALQEAARANKVALSSATIRSETEAEGAVERLARERVKAIIALTAPSVFMGRMRMAEATLKHQVALTSLFSVFPESGALLGYGANLPGIFRQCAGHVNRILRGAKPGEIPVERPTKFELVLNAKTAKALNLKIPASLLAQADRVIE